MREIIFRGKRTDNGEWVYGSLDCRPNQKTYIIYYSKNNHNIINTEEYRVIPETVGQYTGLTDKNGKKIFENDVIIDNYFKLLPNKPHIATFYETYRYGGIENLEFEIIGNIHDKPELLKGYIITKMESENNVNKVCLWEESDYKPCELQAIDCENCDYYAGIGDESDNESER